MKYENGEPVLEEGVVYLRDTRNNKIYQYESNLAQMSFIQTFTAGQKTDDEGKSEDDGRPRPPAPEMTALERAAEYDRIAAMTPAEREAAQAASPIFTEQPAAPEEVKNTTDKVLLVDTSGTTLQAYYDAGWTNETLVQHNHATWNPDYVESVQ